jgi:hypothetical protein
MGGRRRYGGLSCRDGACCGGFCPGGHRGTGSTEALVKDVEDQASLAEREARDWVSRVEAESATTLASACREAEGFAQKIALLEGELMESHRAQDTVKLNSQGLSHMAADTERRWEEYVRECQEWVQELTLLQT